MRNTISLKDSLLRSMSDVSKPKILFLMLCRTRNNALQRIELNRIHITRYISIFQMSIINRGVSSLGSARNLAREPHVFKSSARLGSISGSSRKLEVIFFGS